MGPEKTFENKVKEFIEQEGGWQVKFFANRMTKEGIPDLLTCIDGYFVAIEVKAQKGKPSKLQIHTCKEIRKANGFAFILYPSGFNYFKMFIKALKTGVHLDRWEREDTPLELK